MAKDAKTAEDVKAEPLPETIVSEIEKPEGISAEEWEGMTDEERSALHITDEDVAKTEGELTEEEIDAILAEEDPEAMAAVEADRRAALTDDERAAEDEAAAAAPVTTDYEFVTDEDLLSFRPQVSDADVPLPKVEIEVSKEMTDKLTALDAKEDEIEQKFADGDITATDRRKELRDISKDRDDIKQDITELRMEARVQKRDELKAAKSWDLEQAAFIDARSDLYKQYETDGKTLTMKCDAMFGAFVKAFERVTADPKTAGLTGMRRMIAADKAVREAFNLPLPGGKAKPAVVPKPAAPAAPRPKVKTLSGVPAAEESQQGNPYAHILALTGQDYEDAISKMSPAQADAFMKYKAR